MTEVHIRLPRSMTTLCGKAGSAIILRTVWDCPEANCPECLSLLSTLSSPDPEAEAKARTMRAFHESQLAIPVRRTISSQKVGEDV